MSFTSTSEEDSMNQLFGTNVGFLFNKNKRLKVSKSSSSSPENSVNKCFDKNKKQINTNPLECVLASLFSDTSNDSSDENQPKIPLKRTNDDKVNQDTNYINNKRNSNNVDEKVDSKEEKENDDGELIQKKIVTPLKFNFDYKKDIHCIELSKCLSLDMNPFQLVKTKKYKTLLNEKEQAEMKSKVRNTIRWRQVVQNDGSIINETNTKLTEWSDGSMTLRVGSQVFVLEKNTSEDNCDYLLCHEGSEYVGKAVFQNSWSFQSDLSKSNPLKETIMSKANILQESSDKKLCSQFDSDSETDLDNISAERGSNKKSPTKNDKVIIISSEETDSEDESNKCPIFKDLDHQTSADEKSQKSDVIENSMNKLLISDDELHKVSSASSMEQENTNYYIGDIVWAKIGKFPHWPCIVCNDPNSNTYIKGTPKDLKTFSIHVQFFNDNRRRIWANIVEHYFGKEELLSRYPDSLCFIKNSKRQMKSWNLATDVADCWMKFAREERWIKYSIGVNITLPTTQSISSSETASIISQSSNTKRTYRRRKKYPYPWK